MSGARSPGSASRLGRGAESGSAPGSQPPGRPPLLARRGFAAQLPEAGRFWIRYVPRSWEAPDRPWLHLAAGRLGNAGARAGQGPGASSQVGKGPGASHKSGQGPGASDPAGPPLDDVLYLPPVPPSLARERDALARARLAEGTPLVLQLLPGDETAFAADDGIALVVDLLPALLEGELDRLAAVPGGATAVWPLMPGLTDEVALWERGCRLLSAAGVHRVQALCPELAPADRRRLAEGAPRADVFDALFHRAQRATALERAFARHAYRDGLAAFLPRPLPRPPLHGAGNRRLGGALALAAELWLRLARPVDQAQALYRAARWIDGTAYDVEALAREGNLDVVTALDATSCRLVLESVAGGEPALLAELLAEYLAGEAPDRGSTAAQDGDAAMGGRNAGKDNHQAGNQPAGRLQEVADE